MSAFADPGRAAVKVAEGTMERLAGVSKTKLWAASGVGGLALLAGLKRYSDIELRHLMRQDRADDARHEADTGAAGDAKGDAKGGAAAAGKRKGRPMNRKFLANFKKFLPIMVGTKEGINLAAVGGLLLVRTWMDFWMIIHNARVLGTVAKRDYRQFLTILLELGYMQIPISVVNNLLHFCIDSLALGFQDNVTTHFHKQYMRDITFYNVSNVDSRIANADQLLTQDVKNFANSAANLYSNITKPLVDVIIFYGQLIKGFGVTGPTSMLAYFVAAGAIMTRLRAPFGKYTAMQAKKEGEFRMVHSRVITYSEEIAFYGGNETEEVILNDRWARLRRHMRKSISFRFNLGIFDSIITKYTATIIGYFIVTAPIFAEKNASRYASEPRLIMEDYTRFMRLLQAMVGAVGRLVDAGREMSHFAGYTERVSMLSTTLRDINQGHWERANVVSTEFVGKRGVVEVVDAEHPAIVFDRVPIVTPNGDCLVPELSFEVRHGHNTLISGPNGCGKSSLFRTLGGLWPVVGGRVVRPAAQNLFYVPQKPYLALGTFRDQIIYPDSVKRARGKGWTDDKIMELLEVVQLVRVYDAHGGWDSTKDWYDVLSGGEKQRVAMARLFYHKPQFAILDECTSQCSVDVEGKMYSYAKEVGITLFTVSHRVSLWPYHEHLLKFDGMRGYVFKKMESADYPQ
jgi:ATP-binding cassette, subfamily D (ALD), member 3